MLPPIDQITIKTSNPKCRLYCCLIEFIDLSVSHVGIFDPCCKLAPLWAPYDRGARTSTARDTQRHATPPEPVPLRNISSTSSCVYSNHNVHMYTLNKVSTPLPLVLITSYCVGTSPPLYFLSSSPPPPSLCDYRGMYLYSVYRGGGGIRLCGEHLQELYTVHLTRLWT